jgi:hypothetical protein
MRIRKGEVFHTKPKYGDVAMLEGEFLVRIVEVAGRSDKDSLLKVYVSFILLACNLCGHIERVVQHELIHFFLKSVVEQVPMERLPLFISWPTKTEEFENFFKGKPFDETGYLL